MLKKDLVKNSIEDGLACFSKTLKKNQKHFSVDDKFELAKHFNFDAKIDSNVNRIKNSKVV